MTNYQLHGEQVAGPDTAVTDLQFSPAGDLVLVSTEAGEIEDIIQTSTCSFFVHHCIIAIEPKS